jgi:hypothetical protein
MSLAEISTANIIPSRTRSGCRSVKPAPVQKPVQMEPTTPATPPSAQPHLLAEWASLMTRSSELYKLQFLYLNNPGDRSKKFGLMSLYSNVATEIQKYIATAKENVHNFKDVERWTELVCWKTRITVFHQAIAVA